MAVLRGTLSFARKAGKIKVNNAAGLGEVYNAKRTNKLARSAITKRDDYRKRNTS